MSNNYYTHGSFPSTGAQATSASMRSELDLITAGFDKLPTLTSNANKFVVVNSLGTALIVTSTLPAATVTDSDFTVQDNADTTKKFQFQASGITTGTTRTYTMPDANTTLVGTDATQPLTNKTTFSATGAITLNTTTNNQSYTTTGAGTITISSGTTGTINNMSIGATTAAAGTFTSLSDSGNLTFTGTGNRITGDFTNATISNGVVIQTSTTNGATSLAVAPNGSSVISGFFAVSGLTANESLAQFRMVGGSDVRINSTITGTGTYLPMTFYTGGSERVRIDTSGNVGIGTASPTARLTVQDATAGNGTIRYGDGSTDYGQIFYRNLTGEFRLGTYGTTTIGMTFLTGGTERMRIDSSGNVSIATGNLTFSGTSQRITGDFSNATIASRLIFQSSTTNGATGIYVIPNGISDQSQIALANASDATNASIAVFGVPSGSTDVRINSSKIGTGTYLPMTFYTSGSERVRIDTSGNVGIGTSSPSTILNAYNATSAIISLDGDATAAFRATRYSTDANLSQFIARKARGTLASPSAVATSDVAGGFFVQAYGGTNFRNIARIDGFVETYTSDTNIAGALRFFTNTSTTDVTEKMRLDSAGSLNLFGSYTEGVVAIGNSGTAQTLSLASGTVQTVTMTGNCTFTMPTATAGKSFILIVNSGAGSFTGTFTSVKWPNNAAPTLTTTASRWDILTFVSNGSAWYGNFAQAYA